jgi:mitochondrial division protein 1
MDFDHPFGTLVTSAMDDTVRVWDLNAGRCLGFLEGHLSSVRCLQVVDNLVATGSMDASIKLWDLSLGDFPPAPIPTSFEDDEDEEDEAGNMFENAQGDAMAPPTPAAPPAGASGLADCEIFTLSAHVAEVTALHLHNKTLVSGSADKTLRQWDLETGRCVQTLDVLWAAAQASTLQPPSTNPNFGGSGSDAGFGGGEGWYKPVAGRTLDPEADFVGAVQVFDAALACGTADGMVRLWDLRSGQVSRSLVGHTGAVTALQFDDVHLVTGSADRSIRVSCQHFPLRSSSHSMLIHVVFRSGIYEPALSSMPLPTTHPSSRCNSIRDASCLLSATPLSKYTTKLTVATGIVVPALSRVLGWRGKSKRRRG